MLVFRKILTPCTDDKICYASVMLCSFYPVVNISETGHVRSRSIAILKKWENYYEII